MSIKEKVAEVFFIIKTKEKEICPICKKKVVKAQIFGSPKIYVLSDETFIEKIVFIIHGCSVGQ